jgi:hypothetical protein
VYGKLAVKRNRNDGSHGAFVKQFSDLYA